MKKKWYTCSLYLNIFRETSGQHGGVGKHGLPPCTTTSKLHVNYRTTITQNHPSEPPIKLNGSPTTMELKKPHPSRLVGGVEMQMDWSQTHVWWIKIQEGWLGNEESQPHTRPPVQGSSARKIRSHTFWLQKPAAIESMEETSGVPSSSS